MFVEVERFVVEDGRRVEKEAARKNSGEQGKAKAKNCVV